MLSSLQVRPNFVAESLITTTVMDALSRTTPRQAFPATRVRARTRDQLEPELAAEEERRRLASLRQMHTNLGHRSDHALARGIRVTGGCAAAVRAALQLRCDVCVSQQHRGPQLLARLRTDGKFGGEAAVDLFVLPDHAGHQKSFMSFLDLASIFGVVATVPSKHPKVIWDHLFKHWITPCGVPRRMIYDHGGARTRVRTGARRHGVVNSCREPSSLHSNTQSAQRRGGLENRRATTDRRVEHQVRCGVLPLLSRGPATLRVMTARTQQRSGFSAGDYDCRTRCWTRLEDSLHERVTRDRAFCEFTATMSAAQELLPIGVQHES